nr:hypothetical protein [Tanacetum cinerariifolium]
MPALLATAEFVTKVHAVCVCCGELAAYSYRLSASESQVLLGEADAYEARCRPCYLAGPAARPLIEAARAAQGPLAQSLLALGARAQGVAYGDWQLHLPANHPQTLADAGDRLYVADESSFYYYDKTLSTTQRLSWREGLSDVGVSAVAYDSASRQVIVAYRNGNLDLLRPDGSQPGPASGGPDQARSARHLQQHRGWWAGHYGLRHSGGARYYLRQHLGGRATRAHQLGRKPAQLPELDQGAAQPRQPHR